MISILWSSASGMLAQAARIDTIANNVANVNTTGFKRQDARFQDLLYRPVSGPGMPVEPEADRVWAGHGVKMSAVTTSFIQGMPRETGRELDMALVGDGFFRILLPDGEEAYTRAGSFHQDAAGNLVTENGYRVDIFPAELVGRPFASLTINPNGQIQLFDENETLIGEGYAQIFRFQNSEGLAPRGENLWLATANSGEPQSGRPGTEGFGVVIQRSLEQSNVNLVEEMTRLIVAQRAYEISSRAVRTADDMWSLANQIRR